ncbi:hypothetical protein [Yoonia sp. 2307UL14-13]|uniref:hypothetical protein n=1 Tax=Yoonia sp. 2307UL14-13 TaxID=3126506 RepID=UPI0030AEFA41
MNKPDQTYPGGIRGLLGRYQKRRALLTHDEGEDLPPLDIDFEPLKRIPLPQQENPRPDGLSRVAKKRHFLLGELPGQSELALLHGLLISHLRKHTYPDHAPALFRRLWREEDTWLLENLDTRWLISAAITFADHGETEQDRFLGQSLKILFSLMKLYEAERSFSGVPPQKHFPLGQRNRDPLPMGMQDFSLLSGDLEAHLLAPLWKLSEKAPNLGRLAQELLNRLDTDDGTLFRRLAIMREKAQKARNKRTSGTQP